MDQGHLSAEAFLAELALVEGVAYARFVAIGNDGQWHLRHLAATVGSEPPEWADDTWAYEEALFVSTELSPSDLASLLGGVRQPVNGLGARIEAPALGTPVSWRRQPSFAPYDRQPLHCPAREYRIAPAETTYTSTTGYLVASEAPTFTDFQAAFRAFFDHDFSPGSPSSMPSEVAVIRLADERGRIGPIHVGATEMTITVEGSDMSAMTLELFGVSDRATLASASPGTYRFPLPHGIPEGAWLWLKENGDWVDYRAITTPWRGRDELRVAGVEIELPGTPTATIEAMIAGGEGPVVEFKSQLPTTPEQRRKAFKTVAAFANGGGGTVVFGVDPDEMTILGLEGESTALRDQLGQMVRSRVLPTPAFEVTPYLLDDDRLVLALVVGSGESPPYGITVDEGSRDRPEFYVRRGASTYHAQPSDLREATMGRIPPPAPSHFRLG